MPTFQAQIHPTRCWRGLCQNWSYSAFVTCSYRTIKEIFSPSCTRNLSSMGFHSSFGAINFWWVWSFTSHAPCEIFVSFPFLHRVVVLYFCWTGAGFGLSRYTQSILLLLWVKTLNCLVNTCLLQRNDSLPGCLILKRCSHEICWESTNSCDYLTALGNGTETRSVFEIKVLIADGGCRQIFETSLEPLGSRAHQRRGCPASLLQWATAIWYHSFVQLRVIGFVKLDEIGGVCKRDGYHYFSLM